MTFLERVCSTALEEAGVPYAVVGGHAVAVHRTVRGTVDVALALGEEAVAKPEDAEALERLS